MGLKDNYTLISHVKSWRGITSTCQHLLAFSLLRENTKLVKITLKLIERGCPHIIRRNVIMKE